MSRPHDAGSRTGGRVRIPADVDRPDRILAGLTARQLVLLAVPTIFLWAAYLLVRRWVPLPVFAVVVAPLVVAAVAIALGQRDGLSLDRLLLAAVRQWRGQRRLVPAPDGIPPTPALAERVDPGPAPSPLTLPARRLDDGGVLDLGPDGTAVIARVIPVNFSLRTPAEQQALVAGFGRWLNSLTTPVQIVVRSTPVDLSDAVHELSEAAGGLPHPALEVAAREHAEFLAGLATSRELLARQVLLILREPATTDGAAGRVTRAAADATAALAGCGLTVAPLDAAGAAAVLAAAVDPWAPLRPAGMADPDAIVTARTDRPA